MPLRQALAKPVFSIRGLGGVVRALGRKTLCCTLRLPLRHVIAAPFVVGHCGIPRSCETCVSIRGFARFGGSRKELPLRHAIAAPFAECRCNRLWRNLCFQSVGLGGFDVPRKESPLLYIAAPFAACHCGSVCGWPLRHTTLWRNLCFQSVGLGGWEL